MPSVFEVVRKAPAMNLGFVIIIMLASIFSMSPRIFSKNNNDFQEVDDQSKYLSLTISQRFVQDILRILVFDA